MAGLRELYRVHTALLARHNATKAPLPPPDQAAADFMESVRREYQANVDRGCWRLDPDRRVLRYTLKGALLTIPRQLPGIAHICRTLYRRRVRRLLSELNLPTHYATVDYAMKYRHLSMEDGSADTESTSASP
jgi:hypothetical protein